MFVVTEEDEAAIRAVYEQRGEFVAAVELRRRFPGVTDTAQATGVRPHHRRLEAAQFWPGHLPSREPVTRR